jgi:hypothetical protein
MPRDSRLTDGVCNGSWADFSDFDLGLLCILSEIVNLVENMSVSARFLDCPSGPQ